MNLLSGLWHSTLLPSGNKPLHANVDCQLTHWGRVTHICVSDLTIIGSDNGLSPGRRQAIIWTNAGILLIGPLGTNFSEILIEILIFSSYKMRLKVSSAKWRPCCLGLNVLTHISPRIVSLVSPGAVRKIARFTTHMYITKNMTAVFSDAYMRH